MTYYIDIDDILANNHIYSADVRQALIDLDQKLFNIITGVDTITAPSSQTMKITAPSNKTIAAGVLTPTASSHDVVSESSTTDDLVTISAASNTQLLFLRASTGHTITVIHGSGNIKTSGLQNVTLSDSKFLMLVGVGSYWYVVNAGGDHAHSTGDVNDLTAFVDGRLVAGTTGGFNTVLLTETTEPTPVSDKVYLWADADGNVHYRSDNGSGYVGNPPGTVIDFAGGSVPAGYLICDGAQVSRATYPNLFVAIGSGSIWGNGDGTTTFHLPDLRGLVLAGLDNMGSFGGANRVTDARADTMSYASSMGAETHTLSLSQIPSHSHNVLRSTSTGGTAGIDPTKAGAQDTPAAQTVPQGGGAAHNNMQPTQFVNKIIKY